MKSGWLAAALSVVVATACDAGDPRPLDWQVRFAEPALEEAARALDAEIRAGGCAGEAIYRVRIDVDGAPPAMTPPDLEPGTYGFYVAAVDRACTRYAQGCEAIELPREPGEAVVVTLALSARVPLCAVEACDDGTCVGMDAGPADAGADDAGQLECAPGTADCNLWSGDLCEVVLGTIEHCADCGDRCRLDHATPACESGLCVVESCDAGWADCDGVAANGCETSTRTLSDCGSCGAACELAHAVEACNMGRCEIVSCYDGWVDCDTADANGCERSIRTATDCGACAAPCIGTTPLCSLAGASPTCTDLCPAGTTQCGSVCVDTATDPDHCGACDAGCDLANASPACVAGACAIGACDPRWESCDGATATGCETSLMTTSNCGACGAICGHVTGVLSCATGICQVDACLEDDIADCDDLATNGCEADLTSPSHCGTCDVTCDSDAPLCGLSSGGPVRCLSACEAPAPDPCEGRCLDTSTDPDNCGGCGLVCELSNATEICLDGTCRVVACAAGFASCDGLDANGCETTPADDPMHCGGCGNACVAPENATATCAGGTCGFTCRAGFGDCDGDAANGCEQPLTTVEHCGGCGVACTRPNATTTCATGSCAIASCNAPFDDCENGPADGCETNTDTERFHCGTCDNRCSGPGTMSCCSGSCGSC